MNGAELRTHLDRMGVSLPWFARQAECSRSALVKYMQPEREQPVPERVEHVVHELLAEFAVAVETAEVQAALHQLKRYANAADFYEAYPSLRGWPEATPSARGVQGALLAAVSDSSTSITWVA